MFRWDRAHALCLDEQGWFFAAGKAKKGTDGCQPDIAGARGAAPFLFEMIQERQNERFVEVLDNQLVDGLLQSIRGIAKQ